MPLRGPFDGFVEVRQARVANLPGALRAQPLQRAGDLRHRPVSVSIYPGRIVVVAEGHVIASTCGHRSIASRGRTIYDWRHYSRSMQRKPGALRTARRSPNCRRLQAAASHPAQAARWRSGDGGDPALVLHHDEQAVLSAVELALDAGVPTKPHVLNMLAPADSVNRRPQHMIACSAGLGLAPGATGQRRTLRCSARGQEAPCVMTRRGALS